MRAKPDQNRAQNQTITRPDQTRPRMLSQSVHPYVWPTPDVILLPFP